MFDSNIAQFDLGHVRVVINRLACDFAVDNIMLVEEIYRLEDFLQPFLDHFDSRMLNLAKIFTQ